MPIYEYRCPKCQKVFEEWVHLADATAEVACPDCNTMSPRIMSETSFVLKGGGWYVTDYGYRKEVKDDAPQTKGQDAAAKVSSSTAESTKAKPAEAPAATSPKSNSAAS